MLTFADVKSLLICWWLLLCAPAWAQAPRPADPPLGVALFEGTPAWDLARAVDAQNLGAMKRLLRAAPALARYQEPRLGQSVLQYAVRTQRYPAVELLLAHGADPNQADTEIGETAVMRAARVHETSAFLRLLLAHGGDPNAVSRPPDPRVTPTTPLMEAVWHRLESVQLLVQAGADVNYRTPTGYRSVARDAFGGERLDIVRYLVIDRRMNVRGALGLTLRGDTLRVGDLLKHMAYPLGSEQFQQKMEIVKYLEAQGLEYRKARVPKHFYQNYSREYLEQY